MKVYLESIGCRLNQSEIDWMGQQFLQAGHTLVSSPDQSDLAIINTCTVTSAAAADSRSSIRRVWRRNPHSRIIVTGCWSTLEADKAAAFPGVHLVIPNSDKDNLASLILEQRRDGLRSGTTTWTILRGHCLHTRAYIKVQDGCYNNCGYCLSAIARGKPQSIPIEFILSQIRAAAAAGAKEAVLTGMQLSAYGRDLERPKNLKVLVNAILQDTAIPRLRLSSLNPWHLPADFFDLWHNQRLCRQLHLPLQSGCQETLNRMRRPIQTETYSQIVSMARDSIPGLAVTTDIMVGFPGETEEEFATSLDFIQRMKFANIHVFSYSPRPGTVAAQLPGMVPNHIKRSRSQQVRQLAQQSATSFLHSFVGQELIALWERSEKAGPKSWRMSGWSDNYLRIQSYVDKDSWNHLCRVKIKSVDKEHLIGDCTEPWIRPDIT
jgi:threonylcarbamoyladenosine tRNA methylthiotransferase MtaB